MAATARDLADDVGVYIRCLLRRRVKLPSRLQNKNAQESIIDILKATVEGVCGADGFVRPNSIEIKSISPGTLEMSSLKGMATYNVLFSADLCNPAVGDILTCRVENVNTYGVLAVNMSETRVLEVILPRQPISFEHSIPLEDMEPGDTLSLEVLGRQFKLGQRTITLVGRAVSKDHEVSRSMAIKITDEVDETGSVAGSDDNSDVVIDDIHEEGEAESEADSEADADADAEAEPDAEIDDDEGSDAEEVEIDDENSVHDQDDDMEIDIDDGMMSD